MPDTVPSTTEGAVCLVTPLRHGRLVCTIAFLVALLLSSTRHAWADDVLGVLSRMDGVWAGDGIVLMIDSERLLANDEPSRPFTRRQLRVRDVTGSMVVFFIGDRRYVALLEEDIMLVSTDGHTGTARLERTR